MSKTENITRTAKDHPFFKNLPAKYLKVFEDCSYTAQYPPGRYLFHEGTEATRFFYIESGKVALEIDIPGRQNISFETIPKGHIVGWSWLMPPHIWVFDGRAVRDVKTVCFDAASIRQLAKEDHTFGFYLYEYFAQIMNRRILSSRMQLMDIYSKTGGNEYL